MISEAIRQLEKSVNLVETDCYEKPKILHDDTTLTSVVEQLNKYLGIEITYRFGENVEVLDGSILHDWLTVSKDHIVTVDRSKIDDYVATLRKRYDTIFRTRKFKTSYGKEITIEGGDYGWWMNYKQEQNELAAMIEACESGERTPVYFQEASQ